MDKDAMSWVSEKQAEIDEEREKGYFNIAEGDNRIQLLTHCAPLAQKWNAGTKKYEIAVEGDKNVSIKGVCWVLQDGLIKEAKLPYVVVKAIKALMEDQDYAFEEFPMPRAINIKAKGAKTKEVEYTVMPSPKETPVSAEILTQLKEKLSPEALVDKKKGKVTPVEYPEEDIDPADIPFD